MAKINFEFSVTAKTLVDVSKEGPENIRKMNIASGQTITANAKNFSPVDTGVLRNSVSYATKTQSGGFNNSGGEKAPSGAIIKPPVEDDVLVGGSRVKYALFVEFGTKYQHAQPFVTRALNQWAKKDFNNIAKTFGKF